MSRPRSRPFLQPLRGQQQVHAERPAQPPDHHEQVDELRLGRQQLGELVDDHEQRGQRGQAGAALLVPLVIADRRVVARGPEQLLAADQFAAQRVPHPVHQRQFLFQVGDDGRDVPEILQPEERRAALEVDQHEVQRLRRMGQRQPQHQRAEQLRLPRPGRADDQAVRPHAALRGFLDVQLDRLAAGVQADRDAEPAARWARPPQRGQVHRPWVGDAEQRGQRGVHRERVVTGRAATGRPQRRQLPGQRLGLGHRQRVRRADPPQHVGARPVRGEHVEPAGGHLEPQRGRVGRARRPAQHLDQGDPVHPVRAELVVVAHRRAVHDHHVVRQRAALAAGEPRPLLQLRAQRRGQLRQARGHQPDRAGRVHLRGVQVVRQPFDPFPAADPVRRRAHADPHVLRRVEYGELAEYRADRAARRGQVAGHDDPGKGPQGHADGQLGHPGVGPDEPAERPGAQRVEVLGRLGLRRHQADRELLRPGAEPDAGEVVVLGAALPDPGPPVGRQHPPQRGGRRAGPFQRRPLRAGRAPDLAPHLAEIAQVVAALAVQLELAVALAPGQLAERHAAHAKAHRAAAHPAQRPGPGAGHHRHHAERHGQHGQVRHHLLQAVGGHFRDLGRRLEHDLPGRHLGRVAPFLAPHNDGAHRWHANSVRARSH